MKKKYNRKQNVTEKREEIEELVNLLKLSEVPVDAPYVTTQRNIEASLVSIDEIKPFHTAESSTNQR